MEARGPLVGPGSSSLASHRSATARGRAAGGEEPGAGGARAAGGRSRVVPARPARTEVPGVRPVPRPALLRLPPHLPPPGCSLLPPDAASRNPFFPLLLLFWSWLLAGCAEGLRVLPKAGWGRSSAARPCGAERRPYGRPPGAPSARRSPPRGARWVCACAPGAGVRPLCARITLGRGSSHADQRQLWAQKLPRNQANKRGHSAGGQKSPECLVASLGGGDRPLVGRGEGALPAGEEELAACWVASVLVFPAWLVVKPDTSTLGPDSGRCCFSSRPSWIFRIFENPVAQEEEKEGGRSRSAEECERGPRPGEPQGAGSHGCRVSGKVLFQRKASTSCPCRADFYESLDFLSGRERLERHPPSGAAAGGLWA